MLKIDVSGLSNFTGPQKPDAKERKPRNTVSKPRSMYCDENCIPEIGHIHRIRCNKLNSHLLDRWFRVIEVIDYTEVVIQRVDNKNIIFKTKTKSGEDTKHLPIMTISKKDLLKNPENTYIERFKDGNRIKISRESREVKLLEKYSVIRLLDCDPMIEHCVFMVLDYEIRANVIYVSKVVNGKKLEDKFEDGTNPISYVDLTNTGYGFVVVASADEVLNNTHPLYGFTKDAYADITNAITESTWLDGLLCVVDGVAKVREIPLKSGIILNICDDQLEILNSDSIPLGEHVQFKYEPEGDKIRLRGLDV